MAIEFIDLKAQLRSIRAPVNERIQKVLDHGQFILGPEVTEMETRLAAYTGAGHCVSVGSGTERDQPAGFLATLAHDTVTIPT
jgi:UDP-2-acetamido-2-deoxy-ribo-hexuluronate aminotransferase